MGQAGRHDLAAKSSLKIAMGTQIRLCLLSVKERGYCNKTIVEQDWGIIYTAEPINRSVLWGSISVLWLNYSKIILI